MTLRRAPVSVCALGHDASPNESSTLDGRGGPEGISALGGPDSGKRLLGSRQSGWSARRRSCETIPSGVAFDFEANTLTSVDAMDIPWAQIGDALVDRCGPVRWIDATGVRGEQGEQWWCVEHSTVGEVTRCG